MDPGPPTTPHDDDPHQTAARTEVLIGFVTAGHFDRAVQLGRDLLATAPDDPAVHYLMALAKERLGQLGDAGRHVDHLLRHQPDWDSSHHAAASLCIRRSDWRAARKHVDIALSLSPGMATYHRLSAVVALHELDLKKARAEIRQARALDPTCPETIQTEVMISSLDETRGKESWKRVSELEGALALAPTDAGLHATLGEIYLDELRMPRKAEECFRSALASDPSNRECQRLLFRSVGEQRLAYRVLSIPQRTFAWMGLVASGFARQPWRILFLLVAVKLVIAFAIWLLLASLVFLPVCRAYEWLLISGTRSAAEASGGRLRLKRRISLLPTWQRRILWGVIVTLPWFTLFALLNIPRAGFLCLGAFVAVHVAFTAVSQWLRAAHSHRTRPTPSFRSDAPSSPYKGPAPPPLPGS